MLSYEIEVHCICGEIKKYTLNALRSQIVVIGRDVKDNLPKIILHSDDETHLSSTELYFAFDVNDKDWVVGTGFPLEKYWEYDKRIAKKGQEIKKAKKEFKEKSYLMENNNFHGILAQVVNSKLYDDKDIENKNLYEDMFTPLQTEKPFKLKELSGICIVPIDKNKPYTYNGKVHMGIKHSILPTIPFHWYIEIKNNRRDTIAVKSFIEKSKFLSKE